MYKGLGFRFTFGIIICLLIVKDYSLFNASFQGAKIPHNRGPLPNRCQDAKIIAQFQCYGFENFEISSKQPDNCVVIHGEIYVVRNIFQTKSDNFQIGVNKFLTKKDYYQSPMPSTALGICQVTDLSDELQLYDIENVESKCLLLPIFGTGEFVALPMVHLIGELKSN